MTVEEVLSLLEKEVAPVALSDRFCKAYSLYDNSGIIINCGKPVTGALFSLDLSEEAIARARERGFNLIVTHHPAIYGGISRIDTVNDYHARNIADCVKEGISVISMHLNFDAAPEGIDYYLMKGIGGDKGEIFNPVEGGGYGRCYGIKEVSFEAFVAHIKKEFSTDRVISYGDGKKKIKKVASFCGAGCDGEAIAFAKLHGVDAFVSSDLKHHEICALAGDGINVVQLTHYSAEAYGFGKIYNMIKSKLGVLSSFCFDDSFA